MLSQLHVKNLGIVSEVEIGFSPGLNIITGETGAGKSLLIDALSLIRGSRFATNLIGPFGTSSSVTAVFQLPESHGARALLAKWDLGDAPADGHLVVRRVCQTGGKTRNYVNDVPVHLRTIVEVTSELVDISSQFANQRLLDERSHLNYLDSFAGITPCRREFEGLFQGTLLEFAELAALQRRRLDLMREKSLLETELSDLETFAPSEQDYLTTKAELARLDRLQLLTREAALVSSRLGDPHSGCAAQLQQAVRQLEHLSTAYPQDIPNDIIDFGRQGQRLVDEMSFQLETLLEQWAAASGGSDKESDGFYATPSQTQNHRHNHKQKTNGSPLRLALESRIERYLELTSRFGVGVSELGNHATRLKGRLGELGEIEERISALSSAAAQHVSHILKLAEQLSAGRNASLKNLGRMVEQELSQLGMDRARFFVELIPVDDIAPILIGHQDVIRHLLRESEKISAAFLSLAKYGAERARFLIATNPGSPSGPLRELASGGELSRLMLSIKKVLFEADTMSVFVFDEIDTGISGHVAAKVGQKLAEFCSTRQAIVVTHLPQVACHGEHHLVVSKTVKKGVTTTQILPADESTRQRELAKMISGESVSEQSLAQAKILLEEARQERPKPSGRGKKTQSKELGLL